MSEKKYDYVIVGSGLAGSVFAYLATQKGKKCLVVEKSNYTGGNVYCEDVKGIMVHKFGPHIFHTKNKEVWDLVSGLVEFNNFRLNTLANNPEDGKIYHLPFNMTTMYELFGTKDPNVAYSKIHDEINRYKETNREIKNLKDQAISMVGTTIFNTLIKNYTEKQWGRKCEDLPASIIKRLPVRYTYDNNYFNDKYQGIPVNGYNELIDKLLYGSDVVLGKDFLSYKEYYESICDKIVYTGCIDEFFDYKYGVLEYRRVEWITKYLPMANFQGTAVINNVGPTGHTRTIEHKHFNTFNDDVYKDAHTVVSKEFPTEWKKGENCQYPINDEKNMAVYNKYREAADKISNKYLFFGRLAEYKYYDMDKIIENALNIKDKI